MKKFVALLMFSFMSVLVIPNTHACNFEEHNINVELVKDYAPCNEIVSVVSGDYIIYQAIVMEVEIMPGDIYEMEMIELPEISIIPYAVHSNDLYSYDTSDDIIRDNLKILYINKGYRVFVSSGGIGN